MVTNLTNYGKQIRFGLSTDDPTVTEWNNGDLILLMDLNKLMMYSEASNDFKEISMGGGGGGGEAHPYIQRFTYTQAESWMSDNPGNVKNFAETYFTNGNGLYWGFVDQSYSGTYGARRFCACRAASDIASHHASEWQRKSGNWSQNYAVTASWYIEAGATITVYFILYTDIPEV